MFAQRIRSGIQSALVPSRISRNFLRIDDAGLEGINNSLIANYFSSKTNFFGDSPETYLASGAGRNDLQDHLFRRLEVNRREVIPWLCDAGSLDGANVLEIGCGTGSSTLALAEQGANVTAVDVEERSIQVAKDRCEAYGVNATFAKANATDVNDMFAGRRFDVIIFFATLEHMTHAERMIAMKATWDMLSRGALWCVIDTPNRLWFYDSHTSLLPFWMWLPDDLAFKYFRFSPREGFRDLYREFDREEEALDFLRRGRGVSFHEFEIAMKRAESLNVVSSLQTYQRNGNMLRKIKHRFSNGYRYESFLAKVGPKIHPGFYQPYLNIIIEKD